MIEFKTGNIFDTKCDAIVCTVNCDGIMGKGLALACKERYPAMFKAYKKACGDSLKHGGDLWYWYNTAQFTFPLFDNPAFATFGCYEKEDESKDSHNILCFATKEHWYNPSKLEWIEQGLQNFNKESIERWKWPGFKATVPYYDACHISSIAFPMLGCSNGKLNWNDVKPLMLKYLDNLPIHCEIYEQKY